MDKQEAGKKKGPLYDVAVVGAGPAGSTAARLLASEGMDVLLLDQHTFPRAKPCGGGLTGAALRLLSDVNLNSVIHSSVTRSLFCCPGEESQEEDHPHAPIHMTSRDELDHLLLQKAREAGAQIKEGHRIVGILRENGTSRLFCDEQESFNARVVLGADGPLSAVARSCGLKTRKRFIPALDAEIKGQNGSHKDGRIVFEIGRVPYGYCWSFPKRSGYSMGILSCDQKGPKGLKAVLMSFVEDQVGPGHGSVRFTGCVLPAYRSRKRLWAEGTLLLGDAAGLTDPLSGEGIQHAVHSARLCVEPVVQAVKFKNQNKLADYQNRVESEIFSELDHAAKFASLFFKFPRACYRMGIKDPFVRGLFTELVAGEKRYSEIHRAIQKNYAARFWRFAADLI